MQKINTFKIMFWSFLPTTQTEKKQSKQELLKNYSIKHTFFKKNDTEGLRSKKILSISLINGSRPSSSG